MEAMSNYQTIQLLVEEYKFTSKLYSDVNDRINYILSSQSSYQQYKDELPDLIKKPLLYLSRQKIVINYLIKNKIENPAGDDWNVYLNRIQKTVKMVNKTIKMFTDNDKGEEWKL